MFANVTPSYDDNNKIIGYYSVRRRPSKDGVAFVSDLYAKLCKVESQGGMKASLKLLQDTLQEAQTTYDKLVINLQELGKTQGYH